MIRQVEVERPAVPPRVFRHLLPGIRAELEQERRFRIEQLEGLAAEAAETASSGDEARRQITRVLTVAAESALGDIDAALLRLEGGTYGSCGKCGTPIPLDRLKILPMTRLCMRCQCLAEAVRSAGITRPNAVHGDLERGAGDDERKGLLARAEAERDDATDVMFPW